MRLLRSALLVSALAIYASPAQAVPILIDFETLADGEDVTGQFGADGIVFSGAMALLSGGIGGSLNEIDFPPSSGNAVVLDTSGLGIRVDFLTGATSVSGRFTYAAPVTLTAFSGATVLGTVSTLFDANYGSTGNPTNELLEFAFGGGITHITLVGDVAFGQSFVLDDFFANTIDAQSIPEPGTLSLLLLGAGALAARQRSAGVRGGRRRADL